MNITLNGIKITQDSKTLAFEKNNNVDEIVITVDTDESWSYKLDVKYPDKYNIGNDTLYNIIDLDRNGNTCSVTLNNEMLPFNGKYTMQLRGINGDKVYHSDIFEAWVKYSIEPGSTYNPVPSEFYQIENKLDDKANEAKQYADEAKQSATDAHTAKTAAETAMDAAVTAQSKADAAQKGAEDAKSEAEASKEASASNAATAMLSAQNAKASEDAAKASEDNAAQSATDAQAAMTAAQAAQSGAEAAQSAAAQSAQEAAGSASTASTSETNAKASEESAKASETAAQASQTAAAGSASSAANSAESASASASAASESASAAAASATVAKASEEAAKASETAAKASETAAAGSASASQQSATSAAESAAVYDDVVADVNQLKQEKANNDDLSQVAKTGDYNDLLNKPLSVPLTPTPKIPEPILKVSAESVNGWTSTDATINGVYTVFDEVNKCNRKVLRFTTSQNGLIKYVLPTSVNIQNCGIMLSFRILNDGITVPNSEAFLELYNGTKRLQVYFRLSYNKISDEYRHSGWWNSCFVYDESMNRSNVSGFDITNITAVGFHIYSNNQERVAEIGDIQFVPKINNGGVITIIDNWGEYVPAMADYAYSKGVRLNLSVIPATITGESTAYDTAGLYELNRIKAQGHFIINHTYAHTFFNDMTPIEIDNSVVKAEQWLEHHDCAVGSRVVSVPSAKMNVESYNAIMATNAQCIYHQWNANTYSINNILLPYYPCVRQLHTSSLDELERALSLANLAKEKGGIVVNGYHDSFWTQDDGASWKAYIDGLCNIDGITNYGIDDFLTGKIK